jgi:hypothetical protein
MLVKTTSGTEWSDCTAGGLKVELGTDANRNGILDPLEVNASLTRYVCNGAPGVVGATGLSTLARTTAEPAGANCKAGGTKVELGVDSNRNGTLDALEVNASLTHYVCSGVPAPTKVFQCDKVKDSTYGSTSSVSCPAGSQLTGGACNQGGSIALAVDSWIEGQTYRCAISGANGNTVGAEAICCKLQ